MLVRETEILVASLEVENGHGTLINPEQLGGVQLVPYQALTKYLLLPSTSRPILYCIRNLPKKHIYF